MGRKLRKFYHHAELRRGFRPFSRVSLAWVPTGLRPELRVLIGSHDMVLPAKTPRLAKIGRTWGTRGAIRPPKFLHALLRSPVPIPSPVPISRRVMLSATKHLLLLFACPGRCRLVEIRCRSRCPAFAPGVGTNVGDFCYAPLSLAPDPGSGLKYESPQNRLSPRHSLARVLIHIGEPTKPKASRIWFSRKRAYEKCSFTLRSVNMTKVGGELAVCVM